MNSKLFEVITYLDNLGVGYEVTYKNKDVIVLYTVGMKRNEEIEELGFTWCELPERYRIMIKK